MVCAEREWVILGATTMTDVSDRMAAIEVRIRANPDDAEAWKVYADLLLDHGDPRGELIMLELQPGAEEDASLRSAIGALLDSHRAAWEPAALPVQFPALLEYRWRHGFVHAVSLRRIDHRSDVRALQGLFTDPQARFLDAITLQFRRAKKQLFRALTHLDFSRLRSFCVCDFVGADKVVHALVQQPTLVLTGLELSYSDLTDNGLSELVDCPQLRSLRRLSLRGSEFGLEGIHALANAPVLSELEELDLYGSKIDIDGATALARSLFLKRITSLCLDVDEEGANALSPSFSRTSPISWTARS